MTSRTLGENKGARVHRVLTLSVIRPGYRDTVEWPPGSVSVPILMHWLWSPLGLFAVLSLPATVGTLFLSDSTFLDLWGQASFLTSAERGRLWLALAVFGIVLAVLSPLTVGRTQLTFSPAQSNWIRRSTRVVLAIVFAAYALWLLIAISRGLSVATLTAALQGNEGTMSVLKNNYLAPVSGLTTWMNAGALAPVLLILRKRVTGDSPHWLLLPLLCLVFFRAYFASERLALIEILVAGGMAMLILRSEPPSFLKTPLRAAACVAGGWLGLLVVFALFEYNRSWINFYAQQPGQSLARFAWERLLGYYATAFNNGVVYLEAGSDQVNLFALMPGSDLLAIDPQIEQIRRYNELLWASSNPEFNNVSGFAVVIGALGTPLFVVGLVALAVAATAAARFVLRGSVPAFAFYAVSAIGILEIARIYYFSGTRYLSVIILVIFMALTYPPARHASRSSKRSAPN